MLSQLPNNAFVIKQRQKYLAMLQFMQNNKIVAQRRVNPQGKGLQHT